MEFQRIETPGISHYAYLIGDAGAAVIVDPSRYIEPYLDAAREAGLRITHVIETHRQEDFVMGSAHLAERTGARIVNGSHELFGHGDQRLEDGDTFRIGGLLFRALHTPGHTPESMSYAVYPAEHPDQAWGVFTGDALFFGDTGRTDLPDAERSSENAALLYDMVHRKLAPLGDATLIFPAHGPGSVCGSGMAPRMMSSIGAEKRYNPVFTLGRDDFARTKGGERIPRPPYFRHMEEVNLKGGLPPRPPEDVPLLRADEFAELAENAKVVDARGPEAFAAGHMPGAYAIWRGGLPVFGGWIAGPDTPLLLVLDDDEQLLDAVRHLGRIGIDGVGGALAGGFGSWRGAGRPIETSAVITPRELSEKVDRFQVLDVRDPDEYAQGHIEGAPQTFVGYLERRLGELPLDRNEPIAVTCSIGNRSGLATSILLRSGFRDVRNLLGGMTAWKALELPTKEGE